MAGNKASSVEAKQAADDRQRSTISFPYTDIGAAIELANAIHAKVGLGNCEEDQLAAWTDQSPKSSGFREQLRVSRMSGLIESEDGHYKLSPLGRSLADPTQERKAKAEAFLNVPLFKAIYEKYRGGVLPPAAALERDMVGVGVSEKQKDRARQVLERSAEIAGFFESGKNRLVLPAAIVGDVDHHHAGDEKGGRGGGGGDGGDEVNLDPIIMGLLKRLPRSGAIWPEEDRDLWLDLLKGSFKLIYLDTATENEKPFQRRV